MSNKFTRKIVRTELRTTVDEIVKKSRHTQYIHGGEKLVETIERRTTTRPAALLDCGHWRNDESTPNQISGKVVLMCYVCERMERALMGDKAAKEHLELEGIYIERYKPCSTCGRPRIVLGQPGDLGFGDHAECAYSQQLTHPGNHE